MLLLVLADPADAASADDFVDLSLVDFGIQQDIRFAGKRNPLGKAVYPEARCLLKKSAADALSRVQSSLRLQERGLKVLDCYRPLSVQKELWKLKPEPTLIDDPAKGASHPRGYTVDVTLVDKDGKELTFAAAYGKKNRAKGKTWVEDATRLREAMAAQGFKVSPKRDWQFELGEHEGAEMYDFSFSAVPSNRK